MKKTRVFPAGFYSRRRAENGCGVNLGRWNDLDYVIRRALDPISPVLFLSPAKTSNRRPKKRRSSATLYRVS